MEIQGLAKVRLGETVRSKFVKRCDVADNTKGRGVLLSKDFIACQVVYTDEPVKGVFYADAATAAKYGMSTRLYYVVPIMRLNTDARGNVIDSSYALEYLRLGEQQYEEFANAALEMEDITHVVLTKKQKGTYGYVKAAPSQKQLPDFVQSAIETAKQVDEETLFVYALTDIAKPFEVYINQMKEKKAELPKSQYSNLIKSRDNKQLSTSKPAALPEKSTVESEEVDAHASSVGFDDLDEFEQ